MVKPLRFVGFMALVFGLALAFMLVVPDEGIRLGGYTLKFPTWEDFKSQQREGQGVAMDEFFDIYARKSDAARRDSIRAAEQAFRERMQRFQYPDDDVSVMAPFFRELAERCRRGRVRILHFGDSQIESHRISGHINRELQQRYGGSGPGWLPVVEVIPTPAVRQQASDNWLRFTVYGSPRSETHKGYGLLGAFARFMPQTLLPTERDTALQKPLPDTGQLAVKPPSPDTTITHKRLPRVQAWFNLSPPARGFRNLRQFGQVRLALGNVTDTVWYRLTLDEVVRDTGRWLPGEVLQLMTWDFGGETPATIRLDVESRESPDFYGISLEDARGIYVDNIPWRGSSGTEFNKMDGNLMQGMTSGDDIAMVIMQFGGNTIPNIKSEEGVEYYGRVFDAQMRAMQRLFPDAVFLVIGPSDMSVKEGIRYVTYPYLPEIRDVMKATAFARGGIYFDMYEAMGGKGSMPAWVSSDPPLAAPDYVHFTHAGAQQVAEWLVEAILHAENQLKSGTPKPVQ